LYNNSGSLPELASTILEDTDWELDLQDSHLSYQTVEESLIKLTIHTNTEIYSGSSVSGFYKISDPDENTYYGDGQSKIFAANNLVLTEGDIIYAFYSSCKG
jgi:hypothetical protein